MEEICPISGKNTAKMEEKRHIMGLFTEKTGISDNYAMIGEDSDGDMTWNTADFDYCWAMYLGGVLEDRGYKTVNGIYYRLFYLPPPPHFRHYEE